MRNRKKKFVFNQKTLTYQSYRPSIQKRIKNGIGFIGLTLLVAVGMLLLYINFMGSPKEKMLEHELDFYKLQYSVLSDRITHIDDVLVGIQEQDDNIYRIIFEAEPLPKSYRSGAYGGVKRYASLEGYHRSEEVTELARKTDLLENRLYVQSKSFEEVFELAKNKQKMLASIPAIQPISNKDLTRTASGWGYRTHPVYKTRSFHKGIDFTSPIGTNVYATGDGVIKSVNGNRYGYGKAVEIDHGYGYTTLYAHLSSFNVKRGQKVKRGDVIAFVGNTGVSTGPHLHYEVHYKGQATNPIKYFFKDLSAREYEEITRISSSYEQSYD